VTRARLLGAAAAPLLAFLPRVAEACPSCAGRDGSGYGVGILIGSMIALPFGVVWVVKNVIGRADRLD
jgi:hypothetical protein